MVKQKNKDIAVEAESPVELPSLEQPVAEPAYVVQLNRFLGKKGPYAVRQGSEDLGTYSRDQAVELASKINKAQFNLFSVKELY